MKVSDKTISKVVNILKWIYLVTFVIELLSFAALVVLIFGLGVTTARLTALFIASPVFIISFLYYWGLKNRKPWLVPVIQIYSVVAIVQHIVAFPKDVAHVILVILGMLLAAFNIWFFSMKSVKKYFNAIGWLSRTLRWFNEL